VAPALVVLLVACSSTPPGDGVSRTYERADVGVYTGGWRGGAVEADAAAAPDVVTTLGVADPTADAGVAPEASEVVVPVGAPCPAGVGCGRVWGTSAYCGGAAPSPELLEQLAAPVPLDGRPLVVRPGTWHDPRQPVTARLSTDSEGRFSFAAEPGEYCLVTVDKYDFLGPQGDPALGEAIPMPMFGGGVGECMDRWSRTCDGVVTIGTEPVPAAELTLHQGCSPNPCLPAAPMP
jgi:hypothetical protein